MFLFTILLNAVAVWLGAQFLRGVQVTDFPRALIIGLTIALLNATLGSFLTWIAWPVRILTFGLFGWVIDALILMVADYFLKGLAIKNFWWALALGIWVSAINTIFHFVFRF